MSEQIRAYIVVLFISAATFFVLRNWFEKVFDKQLHTACFSYWIVLTSVGFLSPNIWIVIAGLSVVLFIRPFNVKPLTLYFYLFTCLPLLSLSIGGLGLGKVIEFNYIRLLALFLLVPALLKIIKDRQTVPIGGYKLDYVVLSFFLLSTILDARQENITVLMRGAFHAFVDIVLVYYVISRGLRTVEEVLEAVTAFTAAAGLLIAIAIFEHLYYWVLYSAMVQNLVGTGVFGYQNRAGALRAVASQGHSIALGAVFLLLVGYIYALREQFKTSIVFYSIAAMLCFGLYATVSRGAWIGAVIAFFIILVFARNSTKNIVSGLLLGIPLLSVVVGSGMVDGIIDLLPFIGTVDATSYREMLFNNSVIVIERNLLFGSKDFMLQPEIIALIQGEGIVDFVNVYLHMALKYGLVGMGLFSLVITLSAYDTYRGTRLTLDKQVSAIGVGLLGSLLGFSFLIYTMSYFLAIPHIFWLLVGLSAAYSIAVRRQDRNRSSVIER